MTSASILTAILTSLLFPPLNPGVNEHVRQQDQTEDIHVEVTGTLRNRFIEGSKKLRSARVYTSQGRLDLVLRANQNKQCVQWSNRKVRINGSLVRQKDHMGRLVWKVKVETLEAVGPEVPWPKIAEQFKSISIERSGGIAGMMQLQTVSPDGKVVYKSLKDDSITAEKQLDHEILMQLHELAGNTRWRQVPKEYKDPQPMSDRMELVISLETKEGSFEFKIDAPHGVGPIRPVFDLVLLADGVEP